MIFFFANTYYLSSTISSISISNKPTKDFENKIIVNNKITIT